MFGDLLRSIESFLRLRRTDSSFRNLSVLGQLVFSRWRYISPLRQKKRHRFISTDEMDGDIVECGTVQMHTALSDLYECFEVQIRAEKALNKTKIRAK
eukprot:884224-Amorphochlora_amoeboformis.AAC.1